MESILGIVMLFVAIIQIIMIVKFFDMASDIKDIRNMILRAIRESKQDIDTVDSNIVKDIVRENGSKGDPAKFTWQTWIAIIIIASGVILYCITSI